MVFLSLYCHPAIPLFGIMIPLWYHWIKATLQCVQDSRIAIAPDYGQGLVLSPLLLTLHLHTLFLALTLGLEVHVRYGAVGSMRLQVIPSLVQSSVLWWSWGLCQRPCVWVPVAPSLLASDYVAALNLDVVACEIRVSANSPLMRASEGFSLVSRTGLNWWTVGDLTLKRNGRGTLIFCGTPDSQRVLLWCWCGGCD